jgi:hypothetical protein
MLEQIRLWLSGSNAPAWVQAIGSVLAILVAIAIPMIQRAVAARDAKEERNRQRMDRLARLSAALRAEVAAARDAIDLHLVTVERTIEEIEIVLARGGGLAGGGPVRPGTMTITDAIVYRQIAAEIGEFPVQLTKFVVGFYSMAIGVGRIAEMGPNLDGAFEVIRGTAPRLKMYGAVLSKMLGKFESSSFASNARLDLSSDELKALANENGYPLDAILRERGLSSQ